MTNHCQVCVVGCDSAVTQVSPSATHNFAGVKADIRSTTSNAHLSVKHETSVDCSSKEGKPVAGPRRQQLILKLQYSPCTCTLPLFYATAVLKLTRAQGQSLHQLLSRHGAAS